MPSLASEPEPPLPTIGQYELLARLGSGGTGLVFKARHSGLKRVVVLKVLSPHRLHEAGTVDRFRVEMEALGRLNHPNVARATDAGAADGYHYLVMEFVAGPDVGRVLKARDRLPVADACEIARQAAEGLAYIHSRGMVHRDIKPSNLLLGADGVVRILDLGLARLRDRADGEEGLTVTGAIMGTADYVAPEQVRGSRDVDIRADVYSLGCTLFALLAGGAPFATPDYDTVYKKFKAHEQQQTPPAGSACPGIPPGLAELIDRMLEKEPDLRPQEPAAVARALAPFCPGSELRRLAAAVGGAEEPLASATGDAHPLTLTGAPPPGSATPTRSEAAPPADTRRERPPAVRRRWPRVAAALAATAVVVATAVPLAWHRLLGGKPPPDDPTRAVKPPDAQPLAPGQRVFRPGEWADLLDRDPVVLAWHDEFPDAVLQLKRPGGPLVVTSGERAVLQLATYEGERYELEARLSQTPWVGGVGVFVQGREEIHGGERTVTADYLLIDLKNPATPQLYRGPLSAFPAARRARVDYVKTYPFLAPTTGEHTLTLTVGPGGPEALTWDGDEAVTGLRAPVLGLDPRAGAAGAVGLVVQNCTVSVRSIRLRPLK